MEGAESKSPTQQEDSHIGPEKTKSIAETIEEFQESVQDIFEEMEEDENFSEMTPEVYEYKKSYLRRHLIELSRLHSVLANQHVLFVKEVSKHCPSLIKNRHLDSTDASSGSESFMSTIKLPSSPVKDDAFEVKETKAAVLLLEMNSNVLGDETTTLKQKLQETENSHLELQKQVADLKLMISESDLRMKTMEEELETSRKRLQIAKDTISYLKGEQSTKNSEHNQMLKYELRSGQELLDITQKQVKAQTEKYHILENELVSLVAEITVRDDKIKKLNTKNDWYKSEISKLGETLKSKERIWSSDVAKLKGQLKDQSKLVDDLKKQFNGVKSDKNRISSKLDTLKDERRSQDKLIKELETRLNTLQVEHEGLVSSSNNAGELNNKLTLKVVELEKEVDRQREVISVTSEEKKEAIRQLSFALEHYMSKYKQLRQSSVANTGCFGFESCLITL